MARGVEKSGSVATKATLIPHAGRSLRHSGTGKCGAGQAPAAKPHVSANVRPHRSVAWAM